MYSVLCTQCSAYILCIPVAPTQSHYTTFAVIPPGSEDGRVPPVLNRTVIQLHIQFQKSHYLAKVFFFLLFFFSLATRLLPPQEAIVRFAHPVFRHCSFPFFPFFFFLLPSLKFGCCRPPQFLYLPQLSSLRTSKRSEKKFFWVLSTFPSSPPLPSIFQLSL